MSSHTQLYQSVLKGTKVSPASLDASNMSPISCLAFSLHNNLPHNTPKRRLELTSISPDSPTSSICSGNSEGIGFQSESPDLWSGSEVIRSSPSRRSPPSPRGKENSLPSPYFSPTHSRNWNSNTSPLGNIQNMCNEALSFSPFKKIASPSRRQSNTPPKSSSPDNCDNCSQDSGYSSEKKVEDDTFRSPIACAPRKLNLDLSPPKPFKLLSPPRKEISPNSRPFSSLSMFDDDTLFTDLMDENFSKKDNQPIGFSTLLSAPIKKCTDLTEKSDLKQGVVSERKPFAIRRCLSMMNTSPISFKSINKSVTPTSSKVSMLQNVSLKTEESVSFSFKRPQPPADLSNDMNSKKRKIHLPSPFDTGSTTVPTIKTNIFEMPTIKRESSLPAPPVEYSHPKPKLHRSNSESQVSIMKALKKSDTVSEKLTGDLSRPVGLPTIESGKHPELASISPGTLADLLTGKYNDKIRSFKIIDSRYPYEYEGGHIKGAESWHSPQMVLFHLAAQEGSPVLPEEDEKRDILIFHCEFSSERGPKAQRLMRENDRTKSTNYPALHFPEMYLLEGGYSVFHQEYPELCTPEGYTMMLDPKHSEELKHFRAKSKSWASDTRKSKGKGFPRSGLKRLSL